MGDNSYNQLGKDSLIGTDTTDPLQVNNLTGVVAVAAGLSHTLALQANGTIKSWGYNNSGQLGNGTYIDTAEPVTVKGLSNVIEIAGGAQISVALDEAGQVWCWGDNFYGQLGIGNTSVSDTSVPVRVPNLNNVVDIGVGEDHILALQADGTIWSWGNNYAGQLGDSTTQDAFAPVKVELINDAIAVAAGSHHSLALTKSGKVWTWGRNLSGQLGDGTTNTDSVPSVVSGVDSVITLTGGQYHSRVLTQKNALWSWGGNPDGQLGDNSTVDRLTPVQTFVSCPIKQPCRVWDTMDVVACNNFVSPSTADTFYSSGTYTDRITTRYCDTVLTINLTLHSPSSDTITASACNNYTVPSGDETYTTSGMYADTISNYVGCDSLLTIDLTVHNATYDTLYPSFCDSFTVPSGDETYETAGTYNDTLINYQGCDSLITIYLKEKTKHVSGQVFQPNGDTIQDSTYIYALQIDSGQRTATVQGRDTLLNQSNYNVSITCGRYLILAVPTSFQYRSYLATYYGDVVQWGQAKRLSPFQDTAQIDIKLQKQTVGDTSGKGSIRGRVLEGAGYQGNKRTQGDPLANVNCAIVETGRDSIYRTTLSDSSGYFEFNGITAGQYNIMVDVPGKPVDTTGLNDFDIQSSGSIYDSVIVQVDSQEVSVINKRLDSLSAISTPTSSGLSVIKTYPNPAQDQLYVQFNNSTSSTASLQLELRTLTGQQLVYQNDIDLPPGKQSVNLPLENVPVGLQLFIVEAGGKRVYQQTIIKVE